MEVYNFLEVVGKNEVHAEETYVENDVVGNDEDLASYDVVENDVDLALYDVVENDVTWNYMMRWKMMWRHHMGRMMWRNMMRS